MRQLAMGSDKLAAAGEVCGWGRNFPLIRNKVICDRGGRRFWEGTVRKEIKE